MKSSWVTAGLVLAAMIASNAVNATDLPIVKACMSLMAPDMLFCTDAHEQVILCDITDARRVDCKTMPQIVRSWRGHPERRELFYRKLYGAETP